MRLRPARPDDLPAILRLIGEARRAQASAGFTQWPAGYPAEADIQADIQAGGALLLAAPSGLGPAAGLRESARRGAAAGPAARKPRRTRAASRR